VAIPVAVVEEEWLDQTANSDLRVEDFAVGACDPEEFYGTECSLVELDPFGRAIDIDVGHDRISITFRTFDHFVSSGFENGHC
jgi:hypothetical protein